MSYTGVYTKFMQIDGDESPKITDMELWEELKDKNDYSSIIESADTYETKEGDCPPETFVRVSGFKTWDMPNYNIERCAVEYSFKDFVATFLRISKCLEPFYFYHSSLPNSFPTLLDVERDIYKVICKNGSVDVKKLEFEKVNEEFV